MCQDRNTKLAFMAIAVTDSYFPLNVLVFPSPWHLLLTLLAAVRVNLKVKRLLLPAPLLLPSVDRLCHRIGKTFLQLRCAISSAPFNLGTEVCKSQNRLEKRRKMFKRSIPCLKTNDYWEHHLQLVALCGFVHPAANSRVDTTIRCGNSGVGCLLEAVPFTIYQKTVPTCLMCLMLSDSSAINKDFSDSIL